MYEYYNYCNYYNRIYIYIIRSYKFLIYYHSNQTWKTVNRLRAGVAVYLHRITKENLTEWKKEDLRVATFCECGSVQDREKHLLECPTINNGYSIMQTDGSFFRPK